MADPCSEITGVSKYVYKWVSNQPNVGEESITDWILFEISQRVKKCGYMKFNRHQEAKTTGADWEWWFVGNKKSLRLRVQAKNIEGKKDVYPSLAYKNRHGLQIKKLINDSKSINAIPMYALYIAPQTTPTVKCKGKPNSGSDEGVFISGAKLLFNNYIKHGKAVVSTSKILGDSNPLSCLLCCHLSNKKADQIQAIKVFINHYFSSEEGDNQMSDGEGLHDEYPDYVRTILDNPGEPISDWRENEFSNSIVDLNAVMVFDLRT